MQTVIPVLIATITGVLGIFAGALSGYYRARSEQVIAQKSAEHLLIDQLQEELTQYRSETNRRLDHLERLAAGYRSFIGVQRDHMAQHGTPLPPWPEDLPR